jgi:hypothetical protein
LLNASQNDIANYGVVITNASESVTSSVATLTVSLKPARATPIIINGFIIGATVTDGGCGYVIPPTISFSSQGGTGAAGYAQLSNGSVVNIVITNAGVGYPTNTLLLIAPPPIYASLGLVGNMVVPPPAMATPSITNGFIVGANLTSGGSGYTLPPSISFSDVNGHGAAAHAQISDGSVTNIVITSAGFGYSPNTLLNISIPPNFMVVLPTASNLMAGQTYQLELANDLSSWRPFGSTMVATNTFWTSPNYWKVSDTNRLFFRLKMLP